MICDQCLKPLSPDTRVEVGTLTHTECFVASHALTEHISRGVNPNLSTRKLHAIYSLRNLRWLAEHHPIAAERLNAEARTMRMILLGAHSDFPRKGQIV